MTVERTKVDRAQAARAGWARRRAVSEAATALGLLGASKGGRARARKLTKAQRTAIARKGGAAFARLPKSVRSATARKAWETKRARKGGDDAAGRPAVPA